MENYRFYLLNDGGFGIVRSSEGFSGVMALQMKFGSPTKERDADLQLLAFHQQSGSYQSATGSWKKEAADKKKRIS